jgi:septum formation inhibitor MinC
MENIEQLIGKYIDNVETPANRLNVTENNITPAGNGLKGGKKGSKEHAEVLKMMGEKPKAKAPAPKKMTIKKKAEPKAKQAQKPAPKKMTIKKKAEPKAPAPKTEPKKPARKLSAWQMYVKENMKSGVTMKQLSEEFKNKKPEPKKGSALKGGDLQDTIEQLEEEYADNDEALDLLDEANRQRIMGFDANANKLIEQVIKMPRGASLKGEKPYHNDLPAYKTPEAEAPRSNSKKIANKTKKLVDESNSTNFFKQEAVIGQSYMEKQPEGIPETDTIGGKQYGCEFYNCDEKALMKGNGKIMRKGANDIEAIKRRELKYKREKLGGMMEGKGAKTRGHLVYSNYNNQDPAQFASPMSVFTNPQNISREILSQMLMKSLEKSFRTKS